MRRFALSVAAACCVLAPVAAASSSAKSKGNTAAQDIAWFNAQRAANGIPAGIVENPDWSAKCDQHITFLEKAGGPLRHEEEPSSPFYTDAGEWGGTHSVLAQGDTWTADSNPWEWAPIHLAQLMDPAISEMGVADRDGYVCATTWPGMERPAPDTTTVVTYPGNNTTTYASETAAENPFTPEELVGLTGATGPNLYVYEWGPNLNDWQQAEQIAISAASLTGPEGSVPVKWVDATTAQIGPYLPEGSGILMPVKPLRNGSSYQASVTFNDGTSYQWTFMTRVLDNRIEVGGFKVFVSGRHKVPGEASVWSDAPNPVIVATFHGKTLKLAWKKRGGYTVARSSLLLHGTKICASSGGGDSGYKPASGCKTI